MTLMDILMLDLPHPFDDFPEWVALASVTLAAMLRPMRLQVVRRVLVNERVPRWVDYLTCTGWIMLASRMWFGLIVEGDVMRGPSLATAGLLCISWASVWYSLTYLRHE